MPFDSFDFGRGAEGIIAVVSGARDFDQSPDEAWAKQQCWRWLRRLPRWALVFHGGARGPDRWAGAYARHLSLHVVEYRIDGLRYVNGVKARGVRPLWTEAPPPDPKATRQEWKEWCHLRDRVMVEDADAACRALGWEARMLALVPGWPRDTHGTEYTAGIFKGRFEDEGHVLQLTSPTEVR